MREEAMRSLTAFVCQLKDSETLLVHLGHKSQATFIEQFVGLLLQQLVEKIDRVREVAGRQLQIFFKYHAADLCQFSQKDELVGLFT